MENGLRLEAEDEEDLEIISAAIQDAIVEIGDICRDESSRALSLILNRFVWENDAIGDANRRGAVLLIHDVLNVRARGIDQTRKHNLLSLLTLDFCPKDPPGGTLSLVFAGGGEIRLTLDCLNLVLADVSPSWRARHRPDHDR